MRALWVLLLTFSIQSLLGIGGESTDYGDLCGQFYWSKCPTYKTSVIGSVTPSGCQAGCQQSEECTTFRFSESQAPYCQHYAWDYISSCEIVAGPTSGSGFFGGGQDYLDCMETLSGDVDSCERMREEECLVSGDNSYRQPGVSSPELCADICYQTQAGMKFEFWQWVGGVEQRCDCYRAVTSVSCSAIAGPPQPSIEYCRNPTTSTDTSTSSSMTTITSTSIADTSTTTPTHTTTISSNPRNEIIILTGGNDGSSWNQGAHQEVETLGGPCAVTIPDLSYPRRAHLTLTTADGEVLTCGGDSDYSCVSLTTKEDNTVLWSPHSTLDSIRWYASSVTLPAGVFILGGYKTETTSSFLPTGDTTWRPGPDIPHGGSDSGCAVAVSDTSFLLIGGEPNYDHIMEYDIDTGAWTEWPRLTSPVGGRRRHQCAVLGQDVIIVGGQDQYHEAQSSI